MAQSLDSILGELNASYDPSRKAINDRIAGLAGQEQADIAGLQGQQKQAFDDITQDAIGRGTFYGGAPIQEQQKYTSTAFLPAVAKLKGQYRGDRLSLVESLNGINLDAAKTANATRQSFMDREYQRQKDEADRAEARRATAAQATSFRDFLGGAGGQTQPVQNNQASNTDQAMKNAAVDDVKSVLKNNNAGQLTRYYKAISTSAARGNPKDQLKLQAMQALMPGLFKGGKLNSNYLANLSRNQVKWY